MKKHEGQMDDTQANYTELLIRNGGQRYKLQCGSAQDVSLKKPLNVKVWRATAILVGHRLQRTTVER